MSRPHVLFPNFASEKENGFQQQTSAAVTWIPGIFRLLILQLTCISFEPASYLCSRVLKSYALKGSVESSCFYGLQFVAYKTIVAVKDVCLLILKSYKTIQCSL